MKFIKHCMAVLAVCAFSHSASAALLEHNGTINNCEPSFVCGLFGVKVNGAISAVLSVPEGPATIQPGDIQGYNSVTGLPTPAVGVAIEGLGTAFSFATASTLVTDALNNLVSGAVELTFTQTQGGPGSDIIRTIVTTIGADGLFTAETRNGPLNTPVVLTASGSGAWADNAPTPVPLPAAAWFFGAGLLGLVGAARRRRTQA